MPGELRALVAFAAAALLTVALVPLARRVALRTSFFDRPVAYKAHASPTPYLGGVAVIAAFIVAAAALGSVWSKFAVVAALALALMAMGTVDDRRNLGPGLRFAMQLGAGAALWAADIRWEIAGVAWLDLPITMIWVAGLANAFNLLDNIDGATGTTAAVSAAGIGTLALINDDAALAATAFALSGACAGFLVFNLAGPATIFLGDGGSLPIGFLIAALAMLVPSSLGELALLGAIPLAGIAIFDTTLVVLSRTRRGVNVLTGGRDHTTHRLLAVLGSARRVAAVLVLVQGALCGIALGMQDLSDEGAVAAAIAYVVLGTALLVAFERPSRVPTPAEQSV